MSPTPSSSISGPIAYESFQSSLTLELSHLPTIIQSHSCNGSDQIDRPQYLFDLTSTFANEKTLQPANLLPALDPFDCTLHTLTADPFTWPTAGCRLRSGTSRESLSRQRRVEAMILHQQNSRTFSASTAILAPIQTRAQARSKARVKRLYPRTGCQLQNQKRRPQSPRASFQAWVGTDLQQLQAKATR